LQKLLTGAWLSALACESRHSPRFEHLAETTLRGGRIPKGWQLLRGDRRSAGKPAFEIGKRAGGKRVKHLVGVNCGHQNADEVCLLSATNGHWLGWD
jgi:hypothetical protein